MPRTTSVRLGGSQGPVAWSRNAWSSLAVTDSGVTGAFGAAVGSGLVASESVGLGASSGALLGAPDDFTTTLRLDEDWSSGSIDPSRWYVYPDGNTYGDGNNSIHVHRTQNALVSPATAGGSGNSFKGLNIKESFSGRQYTAAMLGSRERSVWYPRYGRYWFRAKMPHGQGLWPAVWLRHRNGSSVCEVDIMEYFHSQRPGKSDFNLHMTPGTPGNPGSLDYNRYGKVYNVWESPTATPTRWLEQWVDIIPWTQSTYGDGTAWGSPSSSSAYVMFRKGMRSVAPDGTVLVTDSDIHIESQCGYWSALYSDQAFDIAVSACQIGGNYVGHPEDPLGYSRDVGFCLSNYGGSQPCATVKDGESLRYATWPTSYPGSPETTFEVDAIRMWEYTGV